MVALTVIGIGSRLRGDDAVGPLLIDKLAEQANSQLELIDAGSDALGILEYLDGRQDVIIIDACRMGRKPGTLVTFDPAQVDLILDGDPLSLHGLGLAEALRMAESLQLLLKQIKLFSFCFLKSLFKELFKF